MVDRCGIPHRRICSFAAQFRLAPVLLTSAADIVNDGTSSRDGATPSLIAERADIRIRPITPPDYQACVDLQEEVWGPGYADTVPGSLLQVTAYVGGIVLGAFTTTGELAGFLYGLTGVVDGEIVHWSHLLGVRDATRNLGVGRMLKEAQRAELARRGVQRMSWTFDPLVAKNAHLNLNRLGARVLKYVPDMYGTTSSPLHYGLATDRLIVSVDTSAAPPVEQPPVEQPPVPVLSLEPQSGDLAMKDGELPPSVRIEIPTNIRLVIEQSLATAVAWRQSVRGSFQWALGNGYDVTGLYREPVTSRSFYTLAKRAR